MAFHKYLGPPENVLALKGTYNLQQMFQSQIRRAKRLEEIARALKGSKQTLKCFHVAAIFDKSKMISLGWNQEKSSPQGRILYPYENSGLHAEYVASKKVESGRGKEIFVLRIGNNDLVLNSKPCEFCEKVLAKFQFRSIFYTTDNGWSELQLQS